MKSEQVLYTRSWEPHSVRAKGTVIGIGLLALGIYRAVHLRAISALDPENAMFFGLLPYRQGAEGISMQFASMSMVWIFSLGIYVLALTYVRGFVREIRLQEDQLVFYTDGLENYLAYKASKIEEIKLNPGSFVRGASFALRISIRDEYSETLPFYAPGDPELATRLLRELNRVIREQSTDHS